MVPDCVTLCVLNTRQPHGLLDMRLNNRTSMTGWGTEWIIACCGSFMHACEPCHDGTELRSFMLPSGITRTIVSNITPSQESHALVTGPKDSSLTGSCQQSAARADSVRAHRIEPECFRPMVYIALAFLAAESPTPNGACWLPYARTALRPIKEKNLHYCKGLHRYKS